MGESLGGHFDLRFFLDIYDQKSNLLARTYFFVFYLQKPIEPVAPQSPPGCGAFSWSAGSDRIQFLCQAVMQNDFGGI